MSDQHHFDVYPAVAEAGEGPTDEGAPAESSWEQPASANPANRVSTYRPPQIPPPAPARGLSRRGVIGLMVGLPLAGIGVAVWANARPDANSQTGDDGIDWSGHSVRVGSYQIPIPDGWAEGDPVGDEPDEVAVTRGSNRVQVWSYNYDDPSQASALLPRLVTHRLGSFAGTVGVPVDESDGEIHRATVRSSGTVGDKDASLTGQLWIAPSGDALLIVRVLTAGANTARAREVQAMVDKLAEQFG